MAQTILNSRTVRAGGFLVSEANGYRSRETITIVTGANAAGSPLRAGTVLGRITASGKYTLYNPGNTDGSQTVAGLLWDDCDASASDIIATGIVRQCEVNQGELTWFGGASGGQITAGIAGLAALGIIARPSVPA